MSFFPALAGGCLIGLAATALLLSNGQIAGISGIVNGLWNRDGARVAANAAFLVGLLLGPILFRACFHAWPSVTIKGSLPYLAIAGVLVGFGSRLGSGCTSGHGVVGLSRLSPRSMAAVAVFMSVAILTVFFMRQAGLP